MEIMESLHWPLYILSKAVHYKNLTGASSHVGLSQPQLSRLILQIEKEFDVVLLDRSTKRKSGWTPAAFRLAEIYTQNSRKLQNSIQTMLAEQVPNHIHIGTLEGLSELAFKTAHDLLLNSKIKEVAVDIFDQNDLEEKFFSSDLDIVFTSREPNKQKFRHLIQIGYQSIDRTTTNDDFTVLSPYEYGRLKKRPENKLFISNSLYLRKQWLQAFGGTGVIPSKVKDSSDQNSSPALIIGQDHLSESLWTLIKKKYS